MALTRRVVGALALVVVVLPACAPRLDAGSDRNAVPVEEWPAVTEAFLRAMANGDLSAAYDHTCRVRGRFPMTREEFVAHHRDSLRPASWRFEKGRSASGPRGGGSALYAFVTFVDGREARLGIEVYERGVCGASSADRWARDAVDPTPRSEALRRHAESIRDG